MMMQPTNFTQAATPLVQSGKGNVDDLRDLPLPVEKAIHQLVMSRTRYFTEIIFQHINMNVFCSLMDHLPSSGSFVIVNIT